MSTFEIVVDGTLRPDGTIELDAKPRLPPGRVQVVLRTESPQSVTAVPTASENWWQFMQRTRRELEASGSSFMTEDEVNETINWMREDDRIDDLLRDAGQPRAEQH